jgi:pentatricopeptide repeat protein
LAEAHLAQGSRLADQWQWGKAESEYRRAVELNPNLSMAHRSYSAILAILGRHAEAIEEAKLGRQLDPLSPSAATRVGYRLIWGRRYDEAISALRQALEIDPNFGGAYGLLGYAYAGKGMHREAIEAYKKSMELDGVRTSEQIYLGASYAKAGERDKALAILNEMQTTKEYVSPGELPVLLGALGMKDEAFASFEKAFAAHDLQMQFLTIDPAYDPLRDDPRYADLVRRVGLQQ